LRRDLNKGKNSGVASGVSAWFVDVLLMEEKDEDSGWGRGFDVASALVFEPAVFLWVVMVEETFSTGVSTLDSVALFGVVVVVIVDVVGLKVTSTITCPRFRSKRKSALALTLRQALSDLCCAYSVSMACGVAHFKYLL